MLEAAVASAPDGARRVVLAEYLSEVETGAELNTALRTLRDWRQKGEGPPYLKIARRVWYPRAGLAAWLKANEQQPVRGRKVA